MDFQPIASGFCFLEAPRVGDDGVWFTDVVQGGLRRLAPDGSVDEWLRDRRWIGGLVLNRDGAVICSGPDGLVWLDPKTGASGTLLDRIDGEPVRGINDLQPDGRGGLYFGTADVAEAEHGRERDPSALFRLDADGTLTRLGEGYTFANGIGISPDGKRLYVSDTFVGVHAYELTPDGGLERGALLAEEKDADGLAVDQEGGIWVAGIQSGHITRLLPDGRVDRRVALPLQGVTSLCFGGADGRDLYVTTVADGFAEALAKQEMPAPKASLYRARADVAGVPAGRAAFELE